MQRAVEGFRLSPQQRRLWIATSGSEAYRTQCAVIVKGRLDVDRFREAAAAVVDRHEMLRAVFYREPGMIVPIQVVRDRALPLWRFEDLTALPPDRQEAKINEIFEDEGREFDLENGPVLRVCMSALPAHNHCLIVSLPSLCADGLSAHNLIGELIDTYSIGAEDGDTDKSFQYIQFAEWQNELLENSDNSDFVKRWQLNSNCYQPITLPFEKKGKSDICYEISALTLKTDPELIHVINSVAEKYQVTLPAFLLACWEILLGAHSGSGSLAIGCNFDGRKFDALRHEIGLFSKYVLLNTAFDSDLRFSELLRQVEQSINEGYEWQDYFDWDRLLPRNSESPAGGGFDALFSFQPWPAGWKRDNLEISFFRQYSHNEKAKVGLSCIGNNDWLEAKLYYDRSIFESDYIQSLSSGFTELLKSSAGNPTHAIGDLNMLTKSERHHYLVELNKTRNTCRREEPISRVFENQVERSPESVALVFEDHHLTYTELNSRANQLAHLLRRLAVGPDVPVGLVMDRSPQLFIGLLGILKAGGAYVPVDHHQPEARFLNQIIQSDIAIIITQNDLLPVLSGFQGRLICLDGDLELISQEPAYNPMLTVLPENLAYIIYTSGSTGVSKGVAVTHSGLINYVNFICERFKLDDLSENARLHFAMISTISADLGNTSIFASLASGGCLHILGYEITTDAALFWNYISLNQIDFLKIVPSHLNALLASRDQTDIKLSKYLVLGGEALSFSLAQRVSKLDGVGEIVNHYGPTETTIGTLTCRVKNQTSESFCHTLPIGRPISNASAYVLNHRLEPVQTGVTGELFIGGTGLARGYRNHPASTAERFTPHPFSPDGGARLYRTGDFARYLPDGNIEFLGRVDHQLKIRGFRIEPGEIEVLLSSHPMVRQSVVVARGKERESLKLVAYLVTEQMSSPAASELRAFLKINLPEYMIPSWFVILKSLPLTANGKIDRQALPAPDDIRPELQPAFIPPESHTEVSLAKIWGDVLGIKQIGVHDDFFELGGDSILSLQIISRANRLGLRFTPKQLFEHTTIAGLAALLDANKQVKSRRVNEIIQGPVPLLPIQHWFFERNLPQKHLWILSVLLDVDPSVNDLLLEEAAKELVLHHDALRMIYVEKEQAWSQSNKGPEKGLSFERVDLTALNFEEQQAAIETKAGAVQNELDLSAGPMMRMVLFDSGVERDRRLLVIIHHLVVDGVSWRILLEDLQIAYEQKREEKRVELGDKTTSYKEWAERLQEYANGDQLRREVNYWASEARHKIEPLPLDFPNGANTLASGSTISAGLNVQETAELIKELPKAYNTHINEVLLTALLLSFNQWTKSRYLLVEMEGHGREDLFQGLDTSQTVGLFTVHYPVLLDSGSTSDPIKVLKSVKESVRRIPQNGIGYGLLRYVNNDSQMRKRLGSLPEPEVKFNYLGQFDQTLAGASLLKPAKEIINPKIQTEGTRARLININALIVGGQLRVDWTYSRNIQREDTVKHLANAFVSNLRSLIRISGETGSGAYTPADFPAADVSQADLDRLLARINKAGKG